MNNEEVLTDKDKESKEKEKNCKCGEEKDASDECCQNGEDCCNNVESIDSGETKDEIKTPELVEEEKEDFEKKYYYVAAEMDNLRKRFQRERENFIKFGNERILNDLIEVLDNFDHSITALEKEEDEKTKTIHSGMEMVRKQFYDALSKNGLEQIEALGKIFDPNFHEAMAQQPSSDKKEHEILSEYQKGYILNGRLLRPAKVVIAKEVEKKKEKKKKK